VSEYHELERIWQMAELRRSLSKKPVRTPEEEAFFDQKLREQAAAIGAHDRETLDDVRKRVRERAIRG
jgi:hypothetical protein